MISEKFQPTFKWLVDQGVDSAGLEKRFIYLYSICSDIFDLHIESEEQKLPETRDFSNVRFNAMMKVVVMDVLTDILELEIHQKTQLLRATAIPNLTQHVTKHPQDYQQDYPKELGMKLRKLDYDRDLVFAAGPWFFQSNRVAIATNDELLMLLVSDLVDERDMGKPTIMAVDPHINEFKVKDRMDLPKKEYWDRELQTDHEIMDLLFPKVEYSQFPSMILYRLATMVA